MNENKDIIYNYLLSKNFNKAQAVGILANIEKESSYNPTAIGDNNTSFGLCQWHNTRKNDLINYATNHNFDYKKLEIQLDFMINELMTSYKQTYSYIKSQSNNKESSYNVAYKFCKYYEIPANTIRECELRSNRAKILYDEYNIKTISKKLTNEEVAELVIKGVYGNQPEREKRLTKEGYNYKEIQKIVNNKLQKNNIKKLTNEEVADLVILGFYGNQPEREKQLTKEGYDYHTIQSIVNQKLRK